jgi:AhpD family alkylhydroperoxidase
MCGTSTLTKTILRGTLTLLQGTQLALLAYRSTYPHPLRLTPMTNNTAEFFAHWQTTRQKLKDQAPDIARGFGGFYQTVMKEGALSVREKELIAMAIALTQRCEPCINLHVQGCVKAGAEREQILEAAGVAVMMQGGPAYTYVPQVIAALEHLEAKAVA